MFTYRYRKVIPSTIVTTSESKSFTSGTKRILYYHVPCIPLINIDIVLLLNFRKTTMLHFKKPKSTKSLGSQT